MKVSIHMNKTLSGRLRELKNKGKVQLVYLKSARGRLRERLLKRAFIKKFESQFKRGLKRWSY